MYEFHGWIKVLVTSSEADSGETEKKIDELRTFISGINWLSGKIELLLLNGIYILILNAVPNRRRSEADELAEIIDYITRNFKEAYGIVYEYDEQIETPNGRGIFSVNVIKRGRCEVLLDPFLSPFVPIVEDPYEPS